MTGYRVRACNTAHGSENKIHDDSVARRFGFSGGLVPGVDVYAYMMHLPVARWGRAFLEQGAAECRFTRPVYDGETAEVSGSETAGSIAIEVRCRDASCATGSAHLPAQPAAPPAIEDFPAKTVPKAEERPVASPATLAVGAVLCSLPLQASEAFAAQYLRDVRETDELYSREGLVHPGAVLRTCNHALLQSVRLGPWIHVGSRVQNFGVARVGETLAARARVTENYERKGHLYVEFDALVVAAGARPLARVQHTAIYRPRQMAE